MDRLSPVGSTHHMGIHFASMFTAEASEPRTVVAHSNAQAEGRNDAGMDGEVILHCCCLVP